MGIVETVPWDGTDYGEGWEQLAVAYFTAAGLRADVEGYRPDDHGVPTAFRDACEEATDEHFVAAIFAWLNLCDRDLYPGISVQEAPWIVEWASANYLGRHMSVTHFAEYEVANELPDSDWGITWDDYIDWERVSDALEVMDVPDDGPYVYVFDNRYDGPAQARKDWFIMQAPALAVGERVEAFMYSRDGADAHLLPGIVRGKWQIGPGYEWMVAVELAVGSGTDAAGDVIVRGDTQLYRLPVEGRPRQKPTQLDIVPLPTVDLAHKRVVESE